jgi:hypothetical protein
MDICTGFDNFAGELMAHDEARSRGLMATEDMQLTEHDQQHTRDLKKAIEWSPTDCEESENGILTCRRAPCISLSESHRSTPESEVEGAVPGQPEADL